MINVHFFACDNCIRVMFNEKSPYALETSGEIFAS